MQANIREENGVSVSGFFYWTGFVVWMLVSIAMCVPLMDGEGDSSGWAIFGKIVSAVSGIAGLAALLLILAGHVGA